MEYRLGKHLQDHGGYTSRAKDWVLVWHKNFQTKSDAHLKEREIKSWESRGRIEQLVSKSQGKEHPDLSGGSGVRIPSCPRQ